MKWLNFKNVIYHRANDKEENIQSSYQTLPTVYRVLGFVTPFVNFITPIGGFDEIEDYVVGKSG
jgi:hypothetical protein